MKKIIVALLLMASNCIVWANLLKNPSFEIQREQNSDMPESWEVLKKGTFEDSHSVVENVVFSGKKAVVMTSRNPKLQKAVLLWVQGNFGEQFKKIAPGTEIEYSVMATAVDAPCTARIYFESNKARKTYIKAAKLIPGKWTKISVKFKKLDMEYPSPNVYIQLMGNGQAAFDCAYLGKAGENPFKITDDMKSLINGGDAEVSSAQALPVGWRILKRGKKGTASIEENNAASGKYSFSLKSTEKPDGMLAWNYSFDKEILNDIAPESDMVLTMKVNTAGNPATRFRFYVEFMQGKKFIGNVMAKNQSSYVGWTEKTLRFKMPKTVPTAANLYIQLQTEGSLNIDDVELKFAKDVPRSEKSLAADDYCRISSGMPMSNTFISPASPKDFELEMIVPAPEMAVELREIDGKTVQEWKFSGLPVRKLHKLKLELKENLPENAYEFVFKSGSLTDYEWFRIRKEQTHGAWFDEEGILKLQGKKLFPIGIVTPDNSLDSLRVYSQSGINTIHSSVTRDAQIADYLMGELSRFNLNCIDWDNYGLNPNISDDRVRKDVKNKAAFMAKYKNFIGFLNDEAPWNSWKISGIRQHYRMRYKYMPDYILWMNHAPRLSGAPEEPRQSFQSVRSYSRAGNVLGVDIYPVPEGHGHNNLKNRTIACVGEYVDLAEKLSWNTKPVWMILQAFGWSEEGAGKVLNERFPRPTEKQLRFMVYNAITHGARGIFWYGRGARDIYSDWWRIFARVNLELQEVAKLLLADSIKEMKNLPAGLAGVENKYIKIIVNENQKKAVAYNGETIEGQGVLFITDKKIDIALPARFVKETHNPLKDIGLRKEKVLMDAQWTAHPQYLRGTPRRVYVKHDFEFAEKPDKAYFQCSVDDDAEIFINGKLLGSVYGHRQVSRFDIADKLVKGKNQLTAVVENQAGPTGFVYEIVTSNGKIGSGADTRYSFDGKTDWKNAAQLGKPPVAPWKEPTTLRLCK